jgi:uncharacterized DUF497 family protein
MEGFEWDEEKRLRHLAAHGVDVRLAARIFRDAVIEALDQRDGYDEPRYRALGHVGDEYFVVAYPWRGDNRRLISAWKVGADGRRRYQALLRRTARAHGGAR